MVDNQKCTRPAGLLFCIVCLSLLIAQFSLSACASAQPTSQGVTAERAWAVVKEKVLADKLEGKEVFVSPHPLKGGDTIKAMIHEYRVPEKFGSAWVVFINDAPSANWEHRSRYVFVDAISGEYDILKATAPPDDLDSYSKVYPEQ